MSLHLWLAYALAVLLLSLAPGPAAVLIVGHGLRFGTHRTLPTIAGAEAAVALLLLAAGSGVGALLAAAPAAFSAVKLCGALYLIWLGLRQWCARVPGAYAQENAPKNAAAHDIPRHHWLKNWKNWE